MAYSSKAERLRRCTQTKANGTPCRAWARWDDPLQRCAGHGIKPQTQKPGESDKRKPSKPVCKCAAYQWPHRPASGLCRWPDPPIERCPTPAGSHLYPRWERTAEAKILGTGYAQMMRSAVGDNYGTTTGRKRGRPSKKTQELRKLTSDYRRG